MQQLVAMPKYNSLSSMKWLLVVQVAVLLPHVTYLPVWLLVLTCIFTAWRWSSFNGYITAPGPWLRGLAILAGVGLFFVTYRTQFSVEAAVAFFAMTYALKVLEVRQRRDLYLFIFLSFFLLATKFLFDQSLWISLYILLAVGLCLMGLVAINQGVGQGNVRRAGLTVAKLMAQALPLVLAAYVLFPRVAPLWTVPLKTDTTWTGISDRIKPGDVAKLAQSGERAFRVRFEGAPPAQLELYWRALILDEYRGGEWRISDQRQWQERRELQADREPNGTRIADQGLPRYEIIQEPTGKPWGMALASPVKGAGRFQLTEDGLVRFREPLRQPIRYQLGIGTNSPPGLLTDVERAWYTALAPGVNPATVAWVTQLRERHGGGEALTSALMGYFREHPFFYTLEPPLLSGHEIDQFLFQTQRGFCAHFASALTFALRAAGVPARMVVGYQGGEWNPDGGYLMVHQYDAHAWTEAWIDGLGWIQLDPTAMVAPDRVSRGMRQAMARDSAFLAEAPFSLSRYSDSGVVQWLRLGMDRMNYDWQRWVVQYDQNAQLDFFKRWYSGINLQTLGIWLLCVLLAGMLVGLVWLLGAERAVERDPVKRLYRRFERRLARQGMPRLPGETPRRYARRAIQEYPRAAREIQLLERHLERLLYGGINRDRKALQAEAKVVQRAIRRLRLS